MAGIASVQGERDRFVLVWGVVRGDDAHLARGRRVVDYPHHALTVRVRHRREQGHEERTRSTVRPARGCRQVGQVPRRIREKALDRQGRRRRHCQAPFAHAVAQRSCCYGRSDARLQLLRRERHGGPCGHFHADVAQSGSGVVGAGDLGHRVARAEVHQPQLADLVHVAGGIEEGHAVYVAVDGDGIVHRVHETPGRARIGQHLDVERTRQPQAPLTSGRGADGLRDRPFSGLPSSRSSELKCLAWPLPIVSVTGSRRSPESSVATT